MFSDYGHSSDFEAAESNVRMSKLLGELWHDWFEAMSELAYRTHLTCEFLAENGGLPHGRYEPFNFYSRRGPPEGSDESIDMDKLKDCLQSMDPSQATQIVYLVQMIQAMEARAKRRRSRANEADADGADW
jgi:hypothetical protein